MTRPAPCCAKAGWTPMSRDAQEEMEVIETTLLDGRVSLLQPKEGFHASLDTVLLAAAVTVKPQGQLLDVGCGVGSAGLCATLRNKNIYLTGIDIQQELIDLAMQNAAMNKMSERARFFQGDLMKEKIIEDNAFDAVMMNPPYQEAGTHTPSPRKIKAFSHGEDASGTRLQDWVKYAHRKLKQGGGLTMIHRADRLDDVIAALTARRWFGSLAICPLWPRAGENAKRAIVTARKERYKPIALLNGLIIHKKNGDYTTEANKILRGGGSLDAAQ